MLDQQLVRAPDFPDNARWVNSKPLSLRELRGKVVLIDFWDYTCVNCIHTLPYVVEWDSKYRHSGLVTIGVHAPEFSFARETRQVERALAEFNITYPVVLDNDYAIWQAYGNQGWPSKYLIDAKGYIRYQHMGEGEYLAAELAIQAALREADPNFRPLPLTIPVRPEDAPGALCYRPTPELYCGYERGSLGNPEGFAPGVVVLYMDRGEREPNKFYLHGAWRAREEYTELAGSHGHVALRYKARDVNLVLSPTGDPVELMLGLQGAQLIGADPAAQQPRVTVYQDGAMLLPTNAGGDVQYIDGDAVLTPDRPRMARLVSNPDFEEHELRLEVRGKGTALFTFTFTTCVAHE
ncbi:MAG: thioredoxin family protein [Chloroflexi bacterium]|nr:thioredoxin family protein [Chloroflexota bacterium]